jgi:hypothetical protein
MFLLSLVATAAAPQTQLHCLTSQASLRRMVTTAKSDD